MLRIAAVRAGRRRRPTCWQGEPDRKWSARRGPARLDQNCRPGDRAGAPGQQGHTSPHWTRSWATRSRCRRCSPSPIHHQKRAICMGCGTRPNHTSVCGTSSRVCWARRGQKPRPAAACFDPTMAEAESSAEGAGPRGIRSRAQIPWNSLARALELSRIALGCCSWCQLPRRPRALQGGGPGGGGSGLGGPSPLLRAQPRDGRDVGVLLFVTVSRAPARGSVSRADVSSYSGTCCRCRPDRRASTRRRVDRLRLHGLPGDRRLAGSAGGSPWSGVAPAGLARTLTVPDPAREIPSLLRKLASKHRVRGGPGLPGSRDKQGRRCKRPQAADPSQTKSGYPRSA